MKVKVPGHVYELAYLDGHPGEHGTLSFVNREGDLPIPGTQSQEVIRALIDRTHHCHHCLPHRVNEQIVYHLRMALVLHEARALERKVEKGLFMPERTLIGHDGHFALGTQLLYEDDIEELEEEAPPLPQTGQEQETDRQPTTIELSAEKSEPKSQPQVIEAAAVRSTSEPR